MNSSQKSALKKIISDKTSGSSEILNKLNRFFLNNVSGKDCIKESAIKIRKELSHFSVIINYLNKVDKFLNSNDINRLRNFFISFENKEAVMLNRIFENIYTKLPKANIILTISKSGTLIEVFRLWFEKNKKLKIVVSESRPASEGKLMAKSLLKYGIPVELISDAMTGTYVEKVDAVIIGADTVLKNGNVINKTGSLHLAILCRYYKKPFFVLAGKSKYKNNTRTFIKEESPRLLWNYNHPNLKVTNIPFEEIDKKLITTVISE